MSVKDEDGDSFFLHRASGATAWHRPVWLLAQEHLGLGLREQYYVELCSGATRWDRPASGYAGPDEAGWELLWDVARGRAFRWHASSRASEWLPEPAEAAEAGQEAAEAAEAAEPPKPAVAVQEAAAEAAEAGQEAQPERSASAEGPRDSGPAPAPPA